MARQHSSDIYARLKAHTRALVRLCGGVEAAACVTRVHASQLSDYGNPNQAERFAPIDVIADLEAEAGEPIVSRELARLIGPNAACNETDPLKVAAMMAAATGQFSQAALDAMDDGEVTPTELLGLISTMEAVKIEAQRNYDMLVQWREQKKKGAA